MTYHAFRQRGAYGNRVPGLIDNKALVSLNSFPSSGMKLWLDFSDTNTLFTDAGVTNVASDGDLIYQVNDKSPNGYEFLQADSARRPDYYSNIQNSKGIARFDSDYLSLSNALGFTENPEITIFVVLKASLAPSDGSDRFFALGDGSAGGHIALASDASYRYNNGYLKFGGVNLTSGFIITCWYRPSDGDYGDGELYTNGSSESSTGSASATNTPTLSNTRTLIGAAFATNGSVSQFYIGDIAEVLVYSGNKKTNSDIWSILNTKWNIY